MALTIVGPESYTRGVGFGWSIKKNAKAVGGRARIARTEAAAGQLRQGTKRHRRKEMRVRLA